MASDGNTTGSQPKPCGWREGGLALLLIAGTVLLYQPVWLAGFIWDDDSHLTNNPCIIGPLGFKEIWSGEGLYYPLVLSSFWVQHALWGLAPLPYHLVTVGVHAICALLLWQVLRRLAVPAPWFGAALWAWHPVQAESVAWVTELKNTQSGLFYLLAILSFLRWRGLADPKTQAGTGPFRVWQSPPLAYGCTLVLAALAILSKTSTAMLPVVLGLCWWWRERRLRWRALAWLAPFACLSAAASGWTIWEQRFHSMALGPQWNQTWPERLIIAGKLVWFYLGKLLWPHPLLFIYPRWEIRAAQPLAYVPCVGVALFLLVLWRGRARWSRGPLFAFAYFLVSLFPVLGFFAVYFFRYSFAGDHFQYLASMGPLALAAAGLAHGLSALPAAHKPVRLGLRVGLPAVLLAALGFLTWRQAGMFRDDERLWRETLARNPQCAIARNNLGEILFKRGEFQQAKEQYEQGLAAAPDYPELHNNLGNVLCQEGDLDAAVAHYRQALAGPLNYADPHYNLANALQQQGKLEEALLEYHRALATSPRHPQAHYNLANALLRLHRPQEAIAHYQAALDARPAYADAHNNLANALAQTGNLAQAIPHYQKALALKAGDPGTHFNLANALLQLGRADEAFVEYEKGLALDPGNAWARKNLGSALLQSGRVDDAIVQFRRALETNPTDAGTHNNLGTSLLQKGNVDEAVNEFQKCVELEPGSARARFNLGLALSQAGRLHEAKAQFQAVVRLDPAFALPENAQRLLNTP